MVKKYREVDTLLEKRIEIGEIYTCERHYKPEDFYYTPSGRKKIDLNVMPSLNLPTKSHETESPPERPQRVREPPSSKPVDPKCYSKLNDLNKRLPNLKIAPWIFRFHDDEATYLEMREIPYLVPKYCVKVDESLDFTISVFNWPLPDDHDIYKKHHRSIRNVFISELLKEIKGLFVCPGVKEALPVSKLHSVPVEVDENSPCPLISRETHRDQSCILLTASSSVCEKCTKMEKNYSITKSRVEKNTSVAAKPNAPLSHTNPQKIALALKEKRVECKEQKAMIERLQKEIEKNAVEVECDMEKTLIETMAKNEGTMTPFMKLFWSEQKKYRTKGKVSYHPMIIRFALSLAMKSGSAYEELRNSGILILPSRRTLRDYKNAITPTVGFNPDVVAELQRKCENLNEIEKFVVLSFDEVKIQSDLIFDKHSGRVIGFVDVGDSDINSATFSDLEDTATHVLCFFIRSFLGHLKFNFGYFATNSILAHQLFPLFWKAVSILELSCQLKVVAAVCDGASANRKKIKMHSMLGGNFGAGITHRSVNLFSPDRYIWFFSDYPHLIKTSRNCLYHSGFGPSFSRLMWKDGKYLIWQHIREILNLNLKLKIAPKIRNEHVDLTPHSLMRVNLAVQTLSATNAYILWNYVGPHAYETAKFCSLMNTFFDIMNIRNSKEDTFKRNPSQRVFKSVDDERFEWLVNVFLKYFDDWKESIAKISELSAKEKEKMFISRQTMEGLKITVLSMIECTKFLLSSGMPYVLTEKLSQDLLELYFGLQRACGHRSDNPNLYQFGFNDNAYRMNENLAESRIEGNIRGGQKKNKNVWYGVDDSKLQKQKKQE